MSNENYALMSQNDVIVISNTIPDNFAFITDHDKYVTLMVPLYNKPLDVIETKPIKNVTLSELLATNNNGLLVGVVSADDLYLEYVNDFLTIARFAEYYFETPTNVMQHWINKLRVN